MRPYLRWSSFHTRTGQHWDHKQPEGLMGCGQGQHPRHHVGVVKVETIEGRQVVESLECVRLTEGQGRRGGEKVHLDAGAPTTELEADRVTGADDRRVHVQRTTAWTGWEGQEG